MRKRTDLELRDICPEVKTMKKTKERSLKPGRRPVHSGYVFLRTKLIGRENRHIERYLTDLRTGYVRELGPTEEDLSTGQLGMINQLITCVGFTRLVEQKALKAQNIAFLQTDAYIRFLKHARQLCLDLGIKPEKPEKLKYLEDL